LIEKFQVFKKVLSISWYIFQGQNQRMKMLTFSVALRSFILKMTSANFFPVLCKMSIHYKPIGKEANLSALEDV